MSHDNPIHLTVSQAVDFIGLYHILVIVVMVSAGFSPWPVLMPLMTGAMCLIGASIIPASFFKQKVKKMILVIFPDGRVRLQSDTTYLAEGKLGKNQWYTQQCAVLTISVQGETRRLVVLAQQQNPDHFRRLSVWLRQWFADSGHARLSPANSTAQQA